MPYVVKVTAYLDRNGFPVSSVSHAHHFETKTLAETAAEVADGTVKEVKRVITPIEKPKQPKQKKETNKKTKSNQTWMKGGN